VQRQVIINRAVPGIHSALGICRVSKYSVILGLSKIISPSKFHFFKVKLQLQLFSLSFFSSFIVRLTNNDHDWFNCQQSTSFNNTFDIIHSNLFCQLLSRCIHDCLNNKIQSKYYVDIPSNFSNLSNTRYTDTAKIPLNIRYLVLGKKIDIGTRLIIKMMP